jgi:hypothetical protein
LIGSVITIAHQVARVCAPRASAPSCTSISSTAFPGGRCDRRAEGLAAPDGVISTRPPLLRRPPAGLTTVQRVFAIDSKSVANLKNLSETGKPDFVEIMPGLIPRYCASPRN